MRDADAGHDAGRADGARTDADLDGVGASLDEVERGFTGGDVAANHLNVRVIRLDPAHAIQHALRMAVRGVDNNDVDAGCGQRLDALLGAGAGADGGAHPQSFLLVLAGLGVVAGFLDILDRDHAAQLELLVDHQHLLDAVLMQQADGLFLAGALAHRDQLVLGGHGLGHGFVEAAFETEVAAGYDANQIALVDHWHTGNALGAGQFQDIADGCVG